MSDFVYTTAIDKMRKLTERIKVIPGGTSAGKTYGILPILIDEAINKRGLEISIVSESVPHLRKGAMKDFLKIMQSTNRFQEDRWNKVLMTYTFGNTSTIEFFSVDQEARVRGLRRDILYINEVNNVAFETYHQLYIRTRKDIWLDFNPTNEFWVHEELPQGTKDVEWLVLTYKDNEALDESIKVALEDTRAKAYINEALTPPALFVDSNIKNQHWHNWWKVYGLGLTGSVEGVIFEDWETTAEIPDTSRLIGRGLDFGYSKDPAALVSLYRKNENELYWEENIYQKGLTNQELNDLMVGEGCRKKDLLVADSAEPKSIAELRKYGWNITPAQKGRDSINFGINVLQEHHFYVTQNSTNLINELRLYCWDTNRKGEQITKPIDSHNHAIDAMRYLAIQCLSKYRRRKGLRLLNEQYKPNYGKWARI